MSPAGAFSPAAKNFLADFVDTMIGNAVPLREKPSAKAVAEEIELFLGRLPLVYRSGFNLILRAVEMGPVVLGFRRPFGRLQPEEKLEYLRRLEQSERYSHRVLSLLLKTVVFVIYFAHPAMEAAIGYDHHCLRHQPDPPKR